MATLPKAIYRFNADFISLHTIEINPTLQINYTSIKKKYITYSAEIPSPPLAILEAVFPKAHLTSHSRMSGSE